MITFDPVLHIQNANLLLQKDGSWPTFHDAEVHQLNFRRGDIRPEENSWVAPILEIEIELFPLWNDTPWLAQLRFHDCDEFIMSGFNHCNMIMGLTFSFVERGTYTDGSPLPPWIAVEFQSSFGMSMTFKCMRIEVLSCKTVEDGND